jgi:serine/threonine protein kinase
VHLEGACNIVLFTVYTNPSRRSGLCCTQRSDQQSTCACVGRDSGKLLPLSVVVAISREMACATDHAHRHDVTMCDHKLDNSLIGFGDGRSAAGGFTLKICDIGGFVKNDTCREDYP